MYLKTALRGNIMLKKIEYEVRRIEDVIVDLADEIKNGWSIYSYRYPDISFSHYGETNMTVEVTLSKEF